MPTLTAARTMAAEATATEDCLQRGDDDGAEEETRASSTKGAEDDADDEVVHVATITMADESTSKPPAKMSKAKKSTQLGLGQFFAKDPSNVTKMETNKRKSAERAGLYDEVVHAEKHKKVKVAEDFFGKLEAPLMRTEISALLEGMTAAVELRAQMEPVDGAEPAKGVRAPLSGTVVECERAAQIMIAKEPERVEIALKGMARKVLSWHERAAGAFLYLHPHIYGRLDSRTKCEKVAAALGVGCDAVRQWYSLHDKKSEKHIKIWVPLVNDMQWKDVAGCFNKRFVAQWNIADDEVVTEQLAPYEAHISGTQMTILSKFTPGTTTAGRKSAAKSNANTVVMKKKSKMLARKDSGKPRKHAEIEEFVKTTVIHRWDIGDPIGKGELADELRARDDCREDFIVEEGDNFWQSYLDPAKDSAKSGLSNWMSRVLDRMGWSMRKNSIGQTVPEDWREKAEKNAAELCKLFKDEGCTIVLNADQTFVNFYPEEQVVAAPKGVNRVGGRVKADVKAGFTAMVSVNMATSKMDPPFVVYNGTKLKDAVHPAQTLAWKYRNWRHSAPGRTGYMAFQKKHWFDGDITIEWFEWVKSLYPDDKIGISIDMAPCQTKAEVKEYIAKERSEDRLVVGYIDGGLTSVLQVCDLTANKPYKAEIKRLYTSWRADYLKAERAKTPDEPDRRIKIKIQVDKMTELVEQSRMTFNAGQLATRSIAKTFKAAGQHPWEECEEEFKAHLDALEKLPLYKCEKRAHNRILSNNVTNQQATVIGEAGDGVEVDLEVWQIERT